MKSYISQLISTNDSDNAVTFNSAVRLRWAQLSFVSTATAGNRQIELRVKNAAGAVLYSVAAGATQAASLTRTYLFAPGHSRETAFVAAGITLPLPPSLLIPSGGSVQIIDSAAVDAAADDFTLTYEAEEAL